MRGNAHLCRILFSIQKTNFFGGIFRVLPHCFSTESQSQSCFQGEEDIKRFKNAAQVFKKWGCTSNDLAEIFRRQPTLRNAAVAPLHSKLTLLSHLGLGSSDIVKIIHCRPRFLISRINRCFDQRIDQLRSLFGSNDLFLKAIVRNPSLLIYDFHNKVVPVITLYEQLGLTRSEFISMLLQRPTLILRTNMTDEKLDLIRRIGVSKDSKMYKYVVTIIGVSRMETICEKMENLEKFGFLEEEVLELFGRSPLLMTLSVDKVQRNMTFVVGMMKYPHTKVAEHPYLLYASLEDVLKPRVLLAGKIQEMDLCHQIKGTCMMTALRMSEQRFLKAFVLCHENGVRDELLEYYKTVKGIKRLAQSSKKKAVTSGFPF